MGLLDTIVGGAIVTGAFTTLWFLILGRLGGPVLRFVLANVLSLLTAVLVWSVVGPMQLPRFRGSFAMAAFEWALFPQFCVLVAGTMYGMIAVSRAARLEVGDWPPATNPGPVSPLLAQPGLEPPRLEPPLPLRPSPPPPVVHRFNNVIARHWRGELKLWTAYWGVGVFLTAAIGGVLVILTETVPLQSSLHPVVFFAIAMAVWVFWFTILFWQWAGVWRAATNYAIERRSRGRRAVWGGITKAVVIMVALQNFAVVVRQVIPQMSDLTKIAFFDDPDIPPFAVRAMREGREIEITGGFKYGMNLAFTELLERWPDAELVHLNSEGGRIAEALEVFATIRAHRMSTYVSNFCASACTFAFAAGRQRWVGPGAEFGFHSPSAPGYTDGDIEAARQDVLDFLADTGINEAFIRRGLEVAPDDIWIPETETLRRARYITGESELDQFASSGWGFEEGFGANMSAAEFAEISTWRYDWLEQLRDFRPALYERVGEEGLAAYLAGQTPSEVRRAMGLAANRAAHDIQHLASSDTIHNIAVRLVYEYRYLRDRDPAECYAYAIGDPEATFDRLFEGDWLQSQFSFASSIVETARDRDLDPALPRYQAEFEARLAEVLDPSARALLAAAGIAPDEQAAYCSAVIAYFQALLAMPHDRSVALLRGVLETSWRLR